MNIQEIKQQSNQLYLRYRHQIIPEFFYVGYVGILAQYLQSGIFSFFVSLFLCPISHGYVKCAMKLVDTKQPILDYHDSLDGIFSFVKVAPAYLMRKAIILMCILICLIPSFLTIQNLIPEFSIEWFSSLGNALIQTEYFIPQFEYISLILENTFLVVNIIVCIFIYLFLTTLFIPVPYVMELEEFSWTECITYSIRLMKKYFFQFIYLYILYMPRHILYWMVTGCIVLWIGHLNEFLMLFCIVSSLFFYIEVFKGRFEIAKYMFYQKMRGEYHEEDEKYQESDY